MKSNPFFTRSAPAWALFFFCGCGSQVPPAVPTLPATPRIEDFARGASADELWTSVLQLQARPPVGASQLDARERRQKHHDLLVALVDRLERLELSDERRTEAAQARLHALAHQAMDHPPLTGMAVKQWDERRAAFFDAADAAESKPMTGDKSLAGDAAALRVEVVGTYLRSPGVEATVWLPRFADAARRFALGKYADRTGQAQAALASAARMTERSGMVEEAAQCYEIWPQAFPDDSLSALAPATVRRLRSLGKPWSLTGKLHNGADFSLAAYQGRWVLLHLWKSDQPACLAQLQTLAQRQGDYARRNVALVGVCLDGDDQALRQIVRQGVDWPQLFAPAGSFTGPIHPLAVQFGVTPLPFAMLLDPAGRVVDGDLLPGELDLPQVPGRNPAPSAR